MEFTREQLDYIEDLCLDLISTENAELKQQVQELQSKVEKAVITLKFYANREEWGDKGGQFETWDLVFNSSSIDGHGYEKAEQTLKEILEDA